MKNKRIAGGLTTLLLLSALPLAAAFVETFDTDSSNLAADYPRFTLAGLGTGVVTNQQLRLDHSGDPNGSQYVGLTTTGLFGNGSVEIYVDATTINGTPGNHNAALYLGTGTPSSPNLSSGTGNNLIVFHPGFAGSAVRVEGPGGFGNQNLGFTLAQGVLHRLAVQTDGAGTFQFILTDGNNSANSYTNGWVNALNTSFRVGMWTVDVDAGGPSNAIFDNLSIVPEPSGLAIGAMALVVFARRKFPRR